MTVRAVERGDLAHARAATAQRPGGEIDAHCPALGALVSRPISSRDSSQPAASTRAASLCRVESERVRTQLDQVAIGSEASEGQVRLVAADDRHAEAGGR